MDQLPVFLDLPGKTSCGDPMSPQDAEAPSTTSRGRGRGRGRGGGRGRGSEVQRGGLKFWSVNGVNGPKKWSVQFVFDNGDLSSHFFAFQLRIWHEKFVGRHVFCGVIQVLKPRLAHRNIWLIAWRLLTHSRRATGEISADGTQVTADFVPFRCEARRGRWAVRPADQEWALLGIPNEAGLAWGSGVNLGGDLWKRCVSDSRIAKLQGSIISSNWFQGRFYPRIGLRDDLQENQFTKMGKPPMVSCNISLEPRDWLTATSVASYSVLEKLLLLSGKELHVGGPIRCLMEITWSGSTWIQFRNWYPNDKWKDHATPLEIDPNFQQVENVYLYSYSN